MNSGCKHLSKRYWGQHLWARGYFVATTGVVTDEVIQKYIEGHEKLGEGSLVLIVEPRFQLL
ncbi:transposase [Bdellovibrionales bacterium]|nr:transposase [Bdellovibrionales bacterium]